MIEIIPPLGKYKYDTWKYCWWSATLTISCTCGATYEMSTASPWTDYPGEPPSTSLPKIGAAPHQQSSRPLAPFPAPPLIRSSHRQPPVWAPSPIRVGAKSPTEFGLGSLIFFPRISLNQFKFWLFSNSYEFQVKLECDQDFSVRHFKCISIGWNYKINYFLYNC
jgi:hypothetical protein